MPQNFIECRRDQSFLLPPSLLEWLPEGHLAWTVLDAVGELDLSAFYGAYRADGHGRPAYEPAMMVALLLYAYANGNCSSRGIERECVEDVAYRVIAANLAPDHSTIAEFRKRHETALAELFTGVLALCARAGLVTVGVLVVDGTKVHGNASHHNNLDYERLARAILAEADRIDAEEDELYGEKRGDELPAQLQTLEGRRAALREAKRQLEAEREADEQADGDVEGQLRGVLELDAAEIVTRDSGREGWLREGKRQLDVHRGRHPRPVPRARAARLLQAERRMVEELAVERVANDAYEAYRARGLDKRGWRLSTNPPKPYQPPDEPTGVVNTTDPDSHNMQTAHGWVQGYNAQAAVNEQQIVLGAEVMVRSGDFGNLGPVVAATEAELQKAGVPETLGVVIADAGYWHQRQMEAIVSRGVKVLVSPDADRRKSKTKRPGSNGFYTFMRNVLATELGGGLYRKRQGIVEPVFGDIKFNRRIDRLSRRGRSAARAEWRLITTTHNLRKLHKHRLTPAAA